MARISSPNWQYGQGYAPAPFHDVVAVLQQLYIPLEQHVFIDVGCGKGRVLLLASNYSFRRIIGIEYSPRLCAIARNNLAHYRNPDQRCTSLEVVESDAANFEPPLEPLALFFHHPFDEPVFHEVLKQLERSLAVQPRPMTVIYFDPRCGHLFQASSSFRRRTLPASFKLTMPVAIFEARRGGLGC
jgi:SAM-dependent methyltransferase